ncbi:MAG TPA: hypothetical protein VJ529_04300 [Candidatus Bathyarchaeia archaeon]|nr:hypothetical protein [Candidatus Bathyarchaeia archaeon]
MKKTALTFIMLASVLIFAVSIHVNLEKVQAEGSYVVEHVDQNLQIMYNGYVLMNETVQLSGQPPSSFKMGFPYIFGSYLVSCNAFETSNPSHTYPVSLNEPLEGRSGYYGINVDFSGGAPQLFSVNILFSNGLISQNPQNASLYVLIFPQFPSLTQDAQTFNGSITLPKNAVYMTGTIGSVTYDQQNLKAFAFNSSTVTFYVSNYEMQLFDVVQLTRKIGINEFEEITGSDNYQITNKGTFSITTVNIWAPTGASNIAADDQLGRALSLPVPIGFNTSRYTLNFTSALRTGYSEEFIVHYKLPSATYIRKQSGDNNFVVNMTLFHDFDYYVNDTSVTFTLPEGARIQTLSSTLTENSLDFHRNIFQDSATLNKQSVMALDSIDVEIAYEYSSIWAAFRPTTWVLVITLIGIVAFVFIRRPKGPARATISAGGMLIRPEQLRSFVDMYEERMKILREMDSLEEKARRGRIPRQRYKVQRKTLETRLDTSSRKLEELKGGIHSAGSHFSSLMDQLEVAEAQLNEVEANVKTIDARHGRGELSLEAYRRLQGDYQQRKGKAQTTINGILLRLREEIR